MSEKSSIGFKFSFHRRLHLTAYLLGFLILTATISTITVKIIKDRRERASIEQNTPKINYERWQKDLLLFHDKTGRFPKDFRELELLIWNNNDSSKPSLLKNGNSTFLIDNVIYLYYPDANGEVCSLWAVPIGENRKEASTHFLLLTPKSYQVWKGLSLEDADIDRIPKKGVPLDTELARLGLSKQINEEIKGKQGNILSPFGKR